MKRTVIFDKELLSKIHSYCKDDTLIYPGLLLGQTEDQGTRNIYSFLPFTHSLGVLALDNLKSLTSSVVKSQLEPLENLVTCSLSIVGLYVFSAKESVVDAFLANQLMQKQIQEVLALIKSPRNSPPSLVFCNDDIQRYAFHSLIFISSSSYHFSSSQAHPQQEELKTRDLLSKLSLVDTIFPLLISTSLENPVREHLISSYESALTLDGFTLTVPPPKASKGETSGKKKGGKGKQEVQETTMPTHYRCCVPQATSSTENSFILPLRSIVLSSQTLSIPEITELFKIDITRSLKALLHTARTCQLDALPRRFFVTPSSPTSVPLAFVGVDTPSGLSFDPSFNPSPFLADHPIMPFSHSSSTTRQRFGEPTPLTLLQNESSKKDTTKKQNKQKPQQSEPSKDKAETRDTSQRKSKTKQDPASEHTGKGKLIGIVAGSVTGIAAICCGVFFYLKKKSIL
ncbi:hypothetical protein BLNAU_579 [Blattamonas nauphoetae]|uniref:Uncharacterized protein n=1 Tax=Blattamonas nauphoetae TaxID=2049346 RepID=A0ABQ9YLN9_9EUKA|nr:hypothetical protein BLNAU_579 [Blattamonas nauphoetae]